MSRNDDHDKRIAAIDTKIRVTDSLFNQLAIDDHDYQGWYSRLLTSLTIASDGDELIYGFGDASEDSEAVSVALFTSKRVIVAQVPDTSIEEATTTAHAVPRSSILSLSVRASEPVDRKSSAKYAWPGDLEITITYSGLSLPVVIEGASYSPYAEDREAEVWRLVKELQQDLDQKGRSF